MLRKQAAEEGSSLLLEVCENLGEGYAGWKTFTSASPCMNLGYRVLEPWLLIGIKRA